MPGYPVVDPYDSGFLPVGEIHKVHYEQYGKSDGKPGRKSTSKSFGKSMAKNQKLSSFMVVPVLQHQFSTPLSSIYQSIA